MSSQTRFDFDRGERRAALDRFGAVYTPAKGSKTSRAACVAVLRCIESHLGRNEAGALADEWRLTFEGIASETGLSERSVRYAVYQLERDQVLYLTENRLTGWRSHSYRIIWGNVEAAAEEGEAKQKAFEVPAVKPQPITRGDRERGAKTKIAQPLPLAQKPLPLGMATVATRNGNHCHSIEQKKKLNQIPPPPPSPSKPPASHNANHWREVEEALRKLGIGQARTACQQARERGASPDDIQAAILHWQRSRGFWSLGGLAYRVANGIWPPANKAAEAKSKQAADLRERLRRKGTEKGYAAEYVDFVVGMELRRLGLGEWLEVQEVEALKARMVSA